MPKSPGCAPLAAVFIFILVLLVGGTNEGIGFYYTHCDDSDSGFLSCLMDEMAEEEATEPEEGTVTAVGTYEYKGYAVTVTANIPLAGGAVTGTVSGTCEGSFKGTYNGQQNGVISSSMAGVCAPFFVNIPASADFTGTVNKTGKTVPLSFNGRGGGITHDGSMTLTYP